MKAGRQALIFKHRKLKPQVSRLGCELLQEKELPWDVPCVGHHACSLVVTVRPVS